MATTVRIPVLYGACHALADAEDEASLRKYVWGLTASMRYPVTALDGMVTMHRFLLDPKQGFVVDHVNGNGMDNRRCNLRVVTALQNSWNRHKRTIGSSSFKGVWGRPGRWLAAITVRGVRKHLGTFVVEEDAAAAYDAAAVAAFGEFAAVNRPGAAATPANAGAMARRARVVACELTPTEAVLRSAGVRVVPSVPRQTPGIGADTPKTAAAMIALARHIPYERPAWVAQCRDAKRCLERTVW